MSTNDFITEEDFYHHKILCGKTIQKIEESEQEDKKIILIYFTDSSCLELTLNAIDIFYAEEIA